MHIFLAPLLSAFVAAPPEKLPAGIDPALADWTPRPAAGKAEPWEKMTDKDWIDPRFRDMNTGPALNCTFRYPLGKGTEVAYKALVVKLGAKGDAGLVFDRGTMRVSAAWSGGYLNHSDRRFGLLNTPTPKGDLLFASPTGAGWTNRNWIWEPKQKTFTAPMPSDWVKFLGHHLHGNQTVLDYTVDGVRVREAFSYQEVGGLPAVVATLDIDTHDHQLTRFLFSCGPQGGMFHVGGDLQGFRNPVGDHLEIVLVRAQAGRIQFSHAPMDSRAFITRPPGGPLRVQVAYVRCPKENDDKLRKRFENANIVSDTPDVAKGGPKRWGEPLVTKLVRGNEDGPFAVDTLTVPYKNPFGALFFCTGLDFLPGGRIAVCTCHGDVWLVTVDEKAGTCSWQRHATGLYHPLGLKVIGGKVLVLERGQLTRLHDYNGDGEADFYECVNNDWHCGGGEHSYDTCLETDPDGNFYFFKTGDTHTPHGGCLMRVTKDGSKAEVFATGFRHPIGMGMSPKGVLTGADQEGNWMPATRIDQYKKGGFYGDMRAHHRATPPKTYDEPLCWLPREVDNSAGGQTWVPEGAWGALGGKPLHFSYGRCRPYVLLRQELPNDRVQGGVAGLPIEFLSGVCRGRFLDRTLYVCGLNGWQTAAKADGCLQRVRPTGQPLNVPVAFEAKGNTIRLTFSRELDASAVGASANYRAVWWNYRWSGDYGSARWKVSDPTKEGMDDVPVRSSKLLADKRTLELTFEALKPVMQMQVGFNVKAADGQPVVGSVLLTLHETK